MNLIALADDLKQLPDQSLQKELLNPSGSVPSFLVLSELNRRKDMRASYGAKAPQGTIADQFTQGMGSANMGKYGQAMAQQNGTPGQQPQTPPPQGTAPQGMPQAPQEQMPSPSPMGEQPQGFADGGDVKADGKSLKLPPLQSTYTDALKRLAQLQLQSSFGGPQSSPIGADGSDVGGDDSVPVQTPAPTMLQKFQGAMAAPQQDIGTMAAQGIAGAVQNAQPQFNSMVNSMNADTDMAQRRAGMVRNLTDTDPGLSLGETMARRLQGRSTNERPPMPMTTEPVPQAGYQDPGGPDASLPPNAAVSGDPNASQDQFGPPESMGAPEPFGPNGGPQGLASAAIPPAMGAGPGGVASAANFPGGRGGGGRGASGGGGGGGAGGRGGPLSQRAGQSLNDFMDEIRGVAMPDRYGQLAAENASDKDKLKDQVKQDRGLALLTAGLGIMGGTSPFAAVNIGQGAQRGVAYWSEAQKQMNQATRDVRNADQQIAVAQANRDERQLDNGLKLKVTAEETYQKSLDRANSSGIAAADRASRLDMMNKELESKEKDRVDAREQSRINEFGTAASRYTTQADALETKAATIAANPLAQGDPQVAGQVANLQAQAKSLRDQADTYGRMHQQSIIDREVRAGRVVEVDRSKPGYTTKGDKMSKGQKFVDPQGNLRVWQGN